MSLRTYFDRDFRTTLVFTVLGIIVGYVSFLLNSTAQAFLLMIVVAIVFTLILKKAMKIAEGAKWWLGNGVIVYILLWLIAWTLFFNIGLR
jgi:hypothetical protein